MAAKMEKRLYVKEYSDESAISWPLDQQGCDSDGSREGQVSEGLFDTTREAKDSSVQAENTCIDSESNPVPQDPISAIHPPCIYAGDVASAMGFGLCRSKMMNGIMALHSPPMRKDAVEKNGTRFRSFGCVGSRITSELFTLKFKHVGTKCYAALLLRSNRSLLMMLQRHFFAFSSLWTGVLVDTGREQAKRASSASALQLV
uniref:Probable cytochrome c biosynthesis protein n=1 Tax=Nicotiana tabacum TaxID=4097 RepID=A0A1S4AR62_TOBAC|nr:PREDICTED: probable cytochrome c biosynthesis protein [Nicotiana tabacum]